MSHHGSSRASGSSCNGGDNGQSPFPRDSGIPSKGRARSGTDHPPAPTLRPRESQHAKESSSHSSRSFRSSHRSGAQENAPPESHHSSRRAPPKAPEPQGGPGLLQNFHQRIAQGFRGESDLGPGGVGLAGMQRAQGQPGLRGGGLMPAGGRLPVGIPVKLVKFGPHRGKAKSALTAQEREETKAFKRKQAEKLRRSYVFT